MQIFRTLAGYSFGRADIVRRAMAKKKRDVMEKERSAFIYGEKNADGTVSCEGCVNRGVPAKVAEKIFDEMSAFSSYAFNKSHAAAYAFVAYQTAYLKCHYQKEFMSALLTSVLDNPGKLSKYFAECIKSGIKILPPDVNLSGSNFTASEDGIRFGLLAVRNIGGNLVDSLIKERQNGFYKSVYDFCSRLYGNDLNRRAVESLIKSGAFDSFGCTRRQMLQGIEPLMRAVEADKKYTMNGQLDLFGNTDIAEPKGYDLPFVPEMPQAELLDGEKEVTGMYISGHPLAEYSEAFSQKGVIKTYELNDPEKNREFDGQSVSVVGMVSKIRKKLTKSDQTMAFADIEDMYGSINVILFPKLYEQLCERMSVQLKTGAVFKFSGRISVSENGEADMVCDRVDAVGKNGADSRSQARTQTEPKNVPASAAKNIKRGLYLRVSSVESVEYIKAKKIMDVFDGDTPVVVKALDTGIAKRLPLNEGVMINKTLLRCLSEILGEENVINVE